MAGGTCIYCGFRGQMSREHYFPRAFGRFMGMRLLDDRVCDACHNAIRVAEDQLTQWLVDLPRDAAGGPPEEGAFRGVAKVGFHAALIMFDELSGAEPEFEPVRSFIWNGGDWEGIVRQSPEPVFKNLKTDDQPGMPVHCVGVVRTTTAIVANISFFSGKRSPGPSFEVTLSDRLPRTGWPRWELHRFTVDDPTATGGPAGRMARTTGYLPH